MLLAEIHGKRCPEIEGNEDFLTSAVFGHLRLIDDPSFWGTLFEHARSPFAEGATLRTYLQTQGVERFSTDRPEVYLWRDCGQYGEPDVFVQFRSDQGVAVLILIEVKLNSGKSGVGDDDQLSKYLNLLEDELKLPASVASQRRCLIYLTQSPSFKDLKESVRRATSSTAPERTFSLLWQDVHDVAHAYRADSTLYEVARFLSGRGFEHFMGFKKKFLHPMGAGGFYRSPCFTKQNLEGVGDGGFYNR